MESMPKRSHNTDIQMILDELSDAKHQVLLLASDIKEVRDRVLQLPCAVHETYINSYKDIRNALAGSIFGILAIAVACGAIHQQVKNHEKILDRCCEQKG